MNKDIIYQYLDGELSGTAVTDIEHRISSDKQFAEEVALIQDMRSFATTHQKETKAKVAIRDIGEQYKPKELVLQPVETKVDETVTTKAQSTRSKLLYMIPAAIAAVVLLGIFITQTMTTDQLSPESMYASYATVAPLSFSTRESKTEESLLKAQTLFNEKNYTDALPYFKMILVENPTNSKAVFYQGYAKIASGDVPGGRADLEPLLSHPLFQHTARFHLALSYLKMDDVDSARSLLSKIPESSNHYGDAQEILGQL